jgi:hypothetical protein
MIAFLDPATLAALPGETLVPLRWVREHYVPAAQLAPARRRVLSTRQAAREYGWTPQDWGRWAREDEAVAMFPATPRPVRRGDGPRPPWDLPREWCEALYRRRMKLPPGDEGATPSSPAHNQTTTTAPTRLSDTRGNHGPRRARQQHQQEDRRPEEEDQRGNRDPAVLPLAPRLHRP